MLIRLATVTLACTYRRHQEEGNYSFPKAPTVWPGEWEITDIGPVSINGEGHECIITFKSTFKIWTKDADKARKMLKEWEQTLGYDETVPGLFEPDNWQRKAIAIIDLTMDETINIPMVHNVAIPWKDLLDPNGSFHGISAKPDHHSIRIDVAFQVLQDLYVSAKGYEKSDRWTTYKARGLLSGKSSGRHMGWGYETNPVTDVDSLKDRFQHALLASSFDRVNDWRKENDIALESSHVISCSIPKDSLGYPSAETLRMLFSVEGCQIKPQLNASHEGARTAMAFSIAVTDNGFKIMLIYGYEGSGWTQVLSRSRFGEPFQETLLRAKNQMDILIPDTRQRVSEQRSKRERENA